MRRAPAQILALMALVLAAHGPAWAAEETVVGPHTRTQLAITIYQDDIAFVREVRELSLAAGDHLLAFPDVSAALMPETVSLAAAGVTVYERRYEADLLSPAALLAASVGKTVQLVRMNPVTGTERAIQAEVLSAANGIVLRIDDQIVTDLPGRLVFESLPPGLRPRPTLTAIVAAERRGVHQFNLGYLTGGLSWTADYVARLDGGMLALELWATLGNGSGADYPDARVALIAGEVSRVSPPPMPVLAGRAMAMAAEMAPGVAEAPVGDYHRYSVNRPVSLGRGATTQLALMTADAVPVTRVYRLENRAPVTRYVPEGQGEQPQPVEVRLDFENSEAAGLGTPLPSGIVRVYDGGDDGMFLGESRVPPTPDGERVTLTLGRAFDVTARRKITDFQREGTRGEIIESAHRITISNAKAEPVTVEVVETMQGEWRVLEENQAHERITAFQARWPVSVPAGGAAELVYRVRMQLR